MAGDQQDSAAGEGEGRNENAAITGCRRGNVFALIKAKVEDLKSCRLHL